MASQDNILDQQLDVGGSVYQTDQMEKTNETLQLGREIVSGSLVTISSGVGSAVISGASGLSVDSIGRFFTITGATNPSNNGSFQILSYISPSSVVIEIANAIAESNLAWSENYPYSLEDDINYIRTDRSDIKGTPYYSSVPEYRRPSDTSSLIPANLLNISGKTTDAKTIIDVEKAIGLSVPASSSSIVYTSLGNLPIATSANITGIPVWDGYDAGNDLATFVEVYNTDWTPIIVPGNLVVYARVLQNINPDSVIFDFRAYDGYNFSSSIDYTFSSSKTINVFYPFRRRLDLIDDTFTRKHFVEGLINRAAGSASNSNLLQVIGVDSTDTDLNGKLTNTDPNYVFSELDSTPTVVEALNALNAKLGDFNFNNLPDGYTVTEYLDLVSTSGLNATSHENLDTLVHDLAEDGYGVITYTNPSKKYISNYTFYTDTSKTKKVRELQLSYTGTDVTQSITIQYDSAGLEVSRITENYVYNGSRIVTFTSDKVGEPEGNVSDGYAGISQYKHEKLRQLIHFIDEGPAQGFLTGAYKEVIGGVFPSQEIWWTSNLKTEKIVETIITRNTNKTPSSIQWKVYNEGGSLKATVTDTISYSGIIETGRVRTIS